MERLRRGWSQKKVAFDIDTSKDVVSRWETGERTPSLYYQEKLCRLFKKTADELGFLDTAKAVAEPPQEGLTLSLSQGNEVLSLLAQAFSQGIIAAMTRSGEDQTMDKVRRHLMELAVSLAGTTLLLPLQSSIAAEEFLPQCAVSIKGCWQLARGKELALAEEMLSSMLPELTKLAAQPSKYQQTAAGLAAQGKILQGILAMHRLNFVERELYCLEAAQWGKVSGVPILEAAALCRLTYTYTVCPPQRPEKAIDICHAALSVLGDEPSLIKSDITIGLAHAYAQCKEERKALETIEAAKAQFPAHPEQDPSFLYADCDWSKLYMVEGKMYLDLARHYPDRGYYQQAYAAFAQGSTVQSVADRLTSEKIIHQADAARGLGDLDLFATCLKDGTRMALALGSQKRYREAWDVFQRTPQQWRSERQIQELAHTVFLQSGSKLG